MNHMMLIHHRCNSDITTIIFYHVLYLGHYVVDNCSLQPTHISLDIFTL
nr:MAG TPA: hypothetical protein [Caudoviricetes sp.]